MSFITRLKTGPKVVGIGVICAGAFFGLQYMANHTSFNIGKILTPRHYDLPDLQADGTRPDVKLISAPSSSCANVKAPLIRLGIWEWNAQMGLLFANGGICTTKGSLMEKYGVNLQLLRQDDTTEMAKGIVACAKQHADGQAQCSTGYDGVVIMGDGGANFAAQINTELKKLGADYVLKVIGSDGYSRGEDAFMAPINVKNDPKSFWQTEMYDESGNKLAVAGLLIDGVILDGDWNIALNWAGFNNVPNNPDVTTFDSHALNWVNASDYNVAAADYVGGKKCETRKEVSGGKLTGHTVRVCVNAVVTWTPGDVTIAHGRGGLVKVADSLQYRSQMPSVIVASAHNARANRVEYTNLLRAIFEGGDQVKASDANLHSAAKIAAAVYKDEGDPKYHNGDYWYHFFKPVVEQDRTGQNVSLGGSAVNNLNDNKILFGFDGYNDNFKSTYEIFRSIDLQQYPDRFKDKGPNPLPTISEIEDKSFIQGVIDAIADTNGDQGAKGDVQTFTTASTGSQVSDETVYITFATGSATPLPAGEIALKNLKDQIAITGLKIQIDGYTDNTGTDVINKKLSQDRANEVKTWLQSHAPKNFPDARFTSIEGHGAASDDSTPAGRARDRKVEIKLFGAN